MSDLIDRLTSGARTPEQRAAVALLTSLPAVATRDDVVRRWYVPAADGTALSVDWPQVAADVDGRRLPLSTGESAAIRVAASIMGLLDVNLSHLLRVIDSDIAAALISALCTLAAHGRPSALNRAYGVVSR